MHFLKREIEKYRLELKNREANFNRVFADKTPLIIKKPAEITAEEMVSNLNSVTSCCYQTCVVNYLKVISN